MAGVIEIEVDGLNRDLHFRPLQENVRGRLDWNRCERRLREVGDKFDGKPIPGQVLGFDLDKGEGYLVEPLHSAEYAAIRKKLEAGGKVLPEQRRTFSGPGDPEYSMSDTWCFWMASAVRAGAARLLRGKFPETFRRVKKAFVSPDPARARAGETNLMAVLIAMLDPKQRAAFEAAKAELSAAK